MLECQKPHYKIWPDLEQLVVIPARKFGNTTLFKLNRDNILVKQILSLDSALSKMAMKKHSEDQKNVKTIKINEKSWSTHFKTVIWSQDSRSAKTLDCVSSQM